MTDIRKRIVRIEARGPITKHAPTDWHRGWYIPVTFTLDDGSTIDASDAGYSRKRDAVEVEATMPRDALNMTAMFNTHGRYIGFEQRFTTC